MIATVILTLGIIMVVLHLGLTIRAIAHDVREFRAMNKRHAAEREMLQKARAEWKVK